MPGVLTMSTEPTHDEHVIGPDDRCPCGQPQEGSGYCGYACFSKYEMGAPIVDADRVCAFDGCGKDCPDPSETTDAPAVEPVGPPAGPERGTGEAGPETTAQAADCSRCNGKGWRPSGAVGSKLCDRCGGDRIEPVTAEDVARGVLTYRDHYGLRSERPAAVDAALRPIHYREVADSLDRLGHHDAARAVRSTAKDLEDGDG
jgi:hypothetical protein